MATNRKASGKNYSIQSASGAITSGTLVAQENFIGIALGTIASGGTGELAIEGVWNIPVPASTVRGDTLYSAGSNQGATIADSNTAITLTRTRAAAAVAVCIAMTDRDASGNADVLLVPRAAGHAAQQA